MARDNDTQHMAHLNGADVDYGYVTLVAGTVEVATYLSVIDAVKLTWKDDPDRADVLKCDGTITSGAVTVSCEDIAGDEGVWYEFIGRM